MIRSSWFSLCVGFSTAAALSVAQETSFKQISKESLTKLGRVYEIVEGEANIDTETIKRIEIGDGKVLVTFRNKTQEKREAECALLLFNQWGMRLAGVTVSAFFSETLAPGAIARGEANFTFPDAATLLAETGLVLPTDWKAPKFLVIAKTAREWARETQPDVAPIPTFQARPIYPFEMRRQGIAGAVTVTFKIATNGNVVEARALRSSQKGFEQAAIDCVKKWKFKPAMKNGKPFEFEMQVPIVFSLNEDN